MFRFTIRDVLWLTAVVGLAMSWAAEHRRVSLLTEQLQRARWHYGTGVRTGESPEVE